MLAEPLHTKLILKRLRDLPIDQKQAFFDWVSSFTPELDNEVGGDDPESMLNWLKLHETIPTDTTFVFYIDARDGGEQLLGTVSIVKQDRDWHAPENGYVLGGFNVRRELRGGGYGGKIMARLMQEMTEQATQEARAIGMFLRRFI
jgi:RimJ/RimL family protein N-acetyltransferase